MRDGTIFLLLMALLLAAAAAAYMVSSPGKPGAAPLVGAAWGLFCAAAALTVLRRVAEYLARPPRDEEE